MNAFSITRKKLAASMLVAVGLSAIFSSATAADFSQRRLIADTSAKYGMGVDQVPLLSRNAGPGLTVAADQLLKEFAGASDPITTRGTYTTERGEQKLGFVGEGWSMHVYGDGTHVKYRNYAYLDGPNNKPLPLVYRMSQDQLEKLGRNFIATKLGRYVTLGKGEILVPYFTQFQVGGGGPASPDTKPDTEEVFANTVVFTRSVNGIPILGPGSKVAVIFANDGQPAGFDMEWASYRMTGSVQKTASLSEIQGRTKKLSPFDLSASDTKVTRFECGYFDLGARKRDVNAPIQAACLTHANKRQIVDKVAYSQDPNSGHTVAAYMGPIPAGATIERDMSWPQALKLLGITPTNYDVPGDGRLL